MQAEGGEGSDHQEITKQQAQDRRLKMMQGDNQQPQHPPQKCPRCDSLNTKFCYYNNYSLSQPRYFCKACRRYWTQGGTLRNVPVGGGCRKGKRAKTSSSDDNSKPQLPPPAPQPQQVVRNIISTTSASASKAKEPTGLLGSFYQGGGFLSSLAAVQSMNQGQGFKQQMNPSLGVSGSMSSSLNLGMFPGFGIPSFGSPQQHQTQPMNFYQIGNREKGSEGMYMPGAQEGLIQPSWTQSFANYADTALWSTSTATSATNGGGNSSRNTTSGGFSSGQWLDGPGYGPS